MLMFFRFSFWYWGLYSGPLPLEPHPQPFCF
jgi:hypothetical protein